MERLNEKQWKAFPIMGMFEKLTPGKGKGLNHLEQIKTALTMWARQIVAMGFCVPLLMTRRPIR
jgi:hypothetical protein